MLKQLLTIGVYIFLDKKNMYFNDKINLSFSKIAYENKLFQTKMLFYDINVFNSNKTIVHYFSEKLINIITEKN